MENNNFPEAPISVTVTGYYKGFSVLATKRQEEEKLMPLLQDAMNAIDWMEKNGWKPSWRTDEGKSASQPKETQVCPIHNATMYKYTNAKGSWFSHKTDNGYCNGKAKQHAEAPDF